MGPELGKESRRDFFRQAGSGLDGIKMGPELGSEPHRDFSDKLARD